MSETATLPPPEALIPANELADASKTRWQGESADYRRAMVRVVARRTVAELFDLALGEGVSA